MSERFSISKAEAIRAYGGNASALARALGITPQAIYQWQDGEIDEGYALKLWFVLKPDVFAGREIARAHDAQASA